MRQFYESEEHLEEKDEKIYQEWTNRFASDIINLQSDSPCEVQMTSRMAQFLSFLFFNASSCGQEELAHLIPQHQASMGNIRQADFVVYDFTDNSAYLLGQAQRLKDREIKAPCSQDLHSGKIVRQVANFLTRISAGLFKREPVDGFLLLDSKSLRPCLLLRWNEHRRMLDYVSIHLYTDAIRLWKPVRDLLEAHRDGPSANDMSVELETSSLKTGSLTTPKSVENYSTKTQDRDMHGGDVDRFNSLLLVPMNIFEFQFPNSKRVEKMAKRLHPKIKQMGRTIVRSVQLLRQYEAKKAPRDFGPKPDTDIPDWMQYSFLGSLGENVLFYAKLTELELQNKEPILLTDILSRRHIEPIVVKLFWEKPGDSGRQQPWTRLLQFLRENLSSEKHRKVFESWNVKYSKDSASQTVLTYNYIRQVKLRGLRLQHLYDLTDFVESLHKEGWVHGDIVPQNIIFPDLKGPYSSYLIDFDSSTMVKDESARNRTYPNHFNVHIGEFRHPDLRFATDVNKVQYKPEHDIYSLVQVIRTFNYEVNAGQQCDIIGTFDSVTRMGNCPFTAIKAFIQEAAESKKAPMTDVPIMPVNHKHWPHFNSSTRN